MGKREHSHTDLVFVGLSGAEGEIVTFGARSEHQDDRTNLVSYDLLTGEIHCTCKWAETHPAQPPTCWHAREVRKADYARRAAPEVAAWDLAACLSREPHLRRKIADGTASDPQRVIFDLIGERIGALTAPEAVAA